METIQQYLEEAVRKAGSGNKLAAVLKTSSANINRLRTGAGFPGDETVMALADYLGENPERLLLLVQVERCPEKTRTIWADIYKKIANVAAVLLLAFVLIEVALPSPAMAQITSDRMYIMSNGLRANGRRLWTIGSAPARNLSLNFLQRLCR